MNDDSTRRRVVVTGGSRGLGRAICQAFAAHGDRVAVHYARNQAAAENCRESLQGDGHELVRGEFSQPQDAQDVFAAAVEKLGGVDVLVNNAGMFVTHAPLSCEWEAWVTAWQQHIRVNLLGPAWLCHRAIDHMRQHAGGTIINISSRGAIGANRIRPPTGHPRRG